MKELLIFYAFLIGFGQYSWAQKCYPDENGNYVYYLNLNLKTVPDDFNKEAFIELLSSSKNVDKQVLEIIKKGTQSVSKSFPTAKTNFLQKSVTLYSLNNNLEEYSGKLEEHVNLIEIICQPEQILLYEPNDYVLNGGHFQKSHLDLIKAREAWDLTRGDPRILVGITDTRVQENHTELINRITQVRGSNTNPDHHGTAVAGCVAAQTDNGDGISAVGLNSRMLFSSNWGNDNEVLLISQLAGVRVINLSWGSCSYSSTRAALYQSIKDDENVVVVAGAGNKASHCGGLSGKFYPASFPSVLSVTSVGHRRTIGDYAADGIDNWTDCHQNSIGSSGSSHHHNPEVALSAPGYQVRSTFKNNTYIDATGTSFASPIVAGVCGLVAGVNPCLTAAEIQDIVTSTADPYLYMYPENSSYIGLLGSGRVDAYQAVKKALELGEEFIQNKIYTGTVTETAVTTLLSGYNITNTIPFGLVTVTPNSSVVFRGTHKVLLGEGFRVHNNAYFKAEIYDSPCF